MDEHSNVEFRDAIPTQFASNNLKKLLLIRFFF